MSKELFNGTLQTDQFDDNDRIASGQPSIAGSKTMLWSRVKSFFAELFMNITGTNSNIDYLNFDLTPATATNAAGRFWYNVDEETVSFGLPDGGSFEMNKTLEDYYTASGFTPAEGDIVSIITGTGNQNFVELTDATDQTSAYACIGMITAITGGTHVRVTKVGTTHNLPTLLFSEGSVIFVDPANPGKWTDARPGAEYYTIIIGVIAISHLTAGSANIKINTIPKFEDLSNIVYSELTKNGLVPSYDLTSKLWNFTHDINGKKVYHGIESSGNATFDNSTHVLTIALSGLGNIQYWYKGVKYVTTSVITCDLDSFETLTANTVYYFYFEDATGTLVCSDANWNLKEHVPTFMVFWNGTSGIIFKELHNHTRDLDFHAWAHATIGARYGSGLSLTYPNAANDDTLQIESGNIWDEDQNITIAQQTAMRGFYLASAGVYTFANYATPYIGTAGQPQYLDTDTYALTNIGASDFGCYWVYANNDIDRAIATIPTQRATAYNTIADARLETPPNLIGLNVSPEMKLLYRIIYKGDGEFQEFADYRNSSSLPSGGTTNINASAVTLAPTDNIISTNVQGGFSELDTKLMGFASTATAAGTTTLTVNSVKHQYFTGTTTQTVQVPVVSTLKLGRQYFIKNNSTGILTINASDGASRIMYLAPRCGVLLTCISLSGTDAASWEITVNTDTIEFSASGLSEVLTSDNTVPKTAFHAPYAFELFGAVASLNTQQATGAAFVIDINNGANSCLSTKLSIDVSEDTSLTAATPPVLDSTYKYFTKGALIKVEFDQVGSTNSGKGCVISLEVIRT